MSSNLPSEDISLQELFEFKPMNGFRAKECDACNKQAQYHSMKARRISNGKMGYACEQHAKTIPAILGAFESLAEGLSSPPEGNDNE